MNIKKHLITTCLFVFLQLQAQQKTGFIPDSLLQKDYSYLAERIADTQQRDIRKLKLYSKVYLLRSKSENNWLEISNAYKNMLYLAVDDVKLTYADSMVHAARKSKNDVIIGAAYLTKGVVCYNNRKHDLALDNYLLANEYIAKTDDDYLKSKIKYSIAHIKYYLGFYDESIALFKECVDYFRDGNDRAYLNSIHSLGLCYNRIGLYDECSRLNKLGLHESYRLDNLEMITYFRHSESINQYFKKKYKQAITGLLTVLPEMKKQKDFANQTISYFYLGKSYWESHQREKAVQYFIKVDDAFMKEQFIRPDLRNNYELLIDYYKSLNNTKKQLFYIDHLLKADSMLDKNFSYLSSKIHKGYDTKSLLQSKKSIERKLSTRKNLEIVLIVIIIILAVLSIRSLRRKAHYKKKFILLMDASEEDIKLPENETEKELGVNPETAAAILSQLEKFEKNQKFLDSELTINKLSSQFDSNVRYVSKVITHYKHKKYIDYVNDLRVDYVINLIKQENKYRNYTLQALAEEAGFKTSQHFTKAFLSRTGISATFFIKQIKKSHPTGDLS